MSEDPVVFVNVIEVDADRVAEVLDVLREGLEQVVSQRPGFESAELLVDPTGTRVLNVARWRGAADVAATQQDPDAARYAERVAALAVATPGVFCVVHTQR